MDRNQLTGLLVMLGLLLVYFQFFAPDPPEPPIDEITIEGSTPIESAPVEKIETREVLSDSANLALNELKYGAFSFSANGNEETKTVATDLLKIDFSSKGGVIKNAILNEYSDYLGQPLALVVEGKSDFDIYFEHLSKTISLRDLYFDVDTKEYPDSTQVIFSLPSENGVLLQQIYTLRNGSYEVGYDIVSIGFEKLISPQNLVLSWLHKVNRVEPDLKDPRTRTTVRYATTAGDVDYLSATATGHEEEEIESNLSWLAFKQKYFTTAIASKEGFGSGFISSDINLADTTAVKYLNVSSEIPYTGLASGISGFKFYFGPNSYYPLDDFAPGFNENLNLGWSILSVVNKYLVLPIWRFLESFISSYPLIIIILVLIIRLILSPLTYKSHMSMAKMRVLKPELDELKEKNGDDMQKNQKEQMALYQKVGINPLSGCIPMVLQFPILVALFYYIPNAIELRQVSFLWAHDLSTYDSIFDFGFEIPFYGDHISLFTLLMTASTLLYTWSNSQITTVQGPMKSLQYMMPVMLLFFFNSYSSGLTYYYFISNIVSFGQIYLFRTIIDEEKIKKILEENRKKNANKKKSKFQTKLEDAMKSSEEARKNSKKKK